MSLDPKKNGADMSKDAATIVAAKNKDHKKILRKKYPDPGDEAGEIYDFSKPLINPLSRDRAGTVRLGFSDRVIRKRIMDITYNIIYIALIFLRTFGPGVSAVVGCYN